MNKEEIEMLKNFINLGISESASEDIRKYGYLGEKVFNYIKQLETNRDEAIKLMRKKSKLVKKGELCHFAFYAMQMDDVSEVLEILERGKNEKII